MELTRTQEVIGKIEVIRTFRRIYLTRDTFSDERKLLNTNKTQ